ncbi:unnamed protein product [Adineta ricciae]|uniref:LIM zinc-binding domain-containing protein n=1 Tax=Adineta ricciae TaxID=249248 RepID=A0A816EUF0_ADIRI|nr:unnamed protein product [Adineta ricciae]CAF1654393.1 unnamed protein product [Adineta ricciae]
MEGEYVSNIRLELQPRSRRGYRRLFGIRENPYFNEDLFDQEQFTRQFLSEYNRKVLRRGQHVKCNNLIIAVKQIINAPKAFEGNTEVEYRLKGLPLKNRQEHSIDKEKGALNKSFLTDRSEITVGDDIDNEVSSCYCSDCRKSLTNGDYLIKTTNWSRPILCLSCYEDHYTEKCVRCFKAITFDPNSIKSDGLVRVHYVEAHGSYWHSECCVCAVCLKSLIGEKFYQDQYCNQLFCLEHIPLQYL